MSAVSAVLAVKRCRWNLYAQQLDVFGFAPGNPLAPKPEAGRLEVAAH